MFRSIKSKIIFIQVSLSLFAVVLVGSLSYFLMVDILLKDQQEKIEYLARDMAMHLEVKIEERKKTFLIISDGEAFRTYATRYRDTVLSEYFYGFMNEFSSLAYVRADGQEDFKMIAGAPSEDLADISSTSLFEEASWKPNKVFTQVIRKVGDPYSSELEFGVYRRNYFDEFEGMLVGRVRLDDLLSSIERFRFGITGFVLLVDNQGFVLSRPQADTPPLRKLTSINDHSEGMLSRIKAGQSGFGRSDILGLDGFVAHVPVPGQEWSMLAVLPYREFMEAPWALRDAVLIVSVVIIFLSILLSLMISSGITRPIGHLVDVTKRFAGGDLSQRVDVAGRDEVSLLGRSFNQMAEEIGASRESLMESNEYVQNILESMSDALVVVNPEGEIMTVNRGACEMLGYRQQDLLGRHWGALFADGQAEPVTSRMNDFLAGASLTNQEICLTTLDGQEIPVLFTCSTIKNESGAGSGIVCLMRDIVELKKTQELLKTAKEEAELLYRIVPSAIFTVDKSRRITSWNNKAAELTGYTSEEVIGKDCLLFAHQPCQNRCCLHCEDISIPVMNQECMIRRKDGQIRYISKNVDFLQDSEGNVIGGIESFEDITELKQRVDDQRQQWEKFLHNIFGSLTSPFYVINADTYEVEMANEAAGFGELFPNSKCYALTHGKDAPCQGDCVCPLNEVKRTGKPVTVEHRHIDQDGNLRYFEINGFPILDESGRVARMIEYALDITERRKAEDKLREANRDLSIKEQELIKRQEELIEERENAIQLSERAQAATKAKSEFLSSISHEMRTPLNIVIGYVNLLKRTSLNPKQQRLVQTISLGGAHLQGVINNVLDFEKAVAGKLVLEAVNFNLQDMIEQTLDTLRSDAEKKSLDLFFTLDPDVPKEIIGDELRLRQVIMNLVSNAIKFTHEGYVRLMVVFDEKEATASQKTQSRVRFVVEDTGIGISPDKHQAIFEPFVQADGSTIRKYGGTGLGLSICSTLVELMGGRIWVESVPGEGSRFIFTLQLQERAAKEQELEDLIRAKGIKGIKILVAEDEPVSRRVVEKFLDDLECQYDFALDGNEVIEKFKENAYSLCLMDIQMPKLNGIQTTQIIRKDLKLSLPIIALTETIFFQNKKHCMEVGMTDFISKPITLEELKGKILTYVQGLLG